MNKEKFKYFLIVIIPLASLFLYKVNKDNSLIDELKSDTITQTECSIVDNKILDPDGIVKTQFQLTIICLINPIDIVVSDYLYTKLFKKDISKEKLIVKYYKNTKCIQSLNYENYKKEYNIHSSGDCISIDN